MVVRSDHRPKSELDYTHTYIYTCIFQRAWISAWPQKSACGGNWKLRRKVILSIFWGILIRSWWTIQVKRNALWVMFAVFLFWFLIFILFFRAETPTKRAKTPTKQAKTPEMRFSCKTVNFFNTVINNISTIYSVSGHLNQTSSKSLKNTIGQKKTPQAKKIHSG